MEFKDPLEGSNFNDPLESGFVDPLEKKKAAGPDRLKQVATAIPGAVETGANLVSSMPKFVTDTVGSLYALAHGHTGEEKQADIKKATDAGNRVLNNLFGTSMENPVEKAVYEPRTDMGKMMTKKVGQGFEKLNEGVAGVGAGLRAATEAALAGEGQAGAKRRMEQYMPGVREITDPLLAAGMLGHGAKSAFEMKPKGVVPPQELEKRQAKLAEIQKEAAQAKPIEEPLPDISEATKDLPPEVPRLPEEEAPLPELFQDPVEAKAPRIPGVEDTFDRKPMLELADYDRPDMSKPTGETPFESKLIEPLEMAPERPLMEERALTPSEIPAPFPEPFRDLQMEKVERPKGYIPRSQRGMVDPSVIPDFAKKVTELVKFGYDKMTAVKTVMDDFKENNPEYRNNASGESMASMEAINRLDREKNLGQERYRVKANGEIVPLIGADRVDAVAYPGEVIVQKGIGKDQFTVLDSNKANTFAAMARLKKQGGHVNPEVIFDLFDKLKKNGAGLSDRLLERYSRYIKQDKGLTRENIPFLLSDLRTNLVQKIADTRSAGADDLTVRRMASVVEEVSKELEKYNTSNVNLPNLLDNFKNEIAAPKKPSLSVVKSPGNKQGGAWTPFDSSKKEPAQAPRIPESAVEKPIARTELAEYLDNMGKNASPAYHDAHAIVGPAPDIKPNWMRDNLRAFGANMKRTLNNPAATWVINNVNDHKHMAEFKSRIHERELQTQLRSFKRFFGSNEEMHKAVNEFVKGIEPSTERGRKLHEVINKINDSIYKDLNEAFKAEQARKGVPPTDLPYQKNYIAHTWEGPYEFKVRNPDTGRVLYVVKETTKAGAEKAMKYITDKMKETGIHQDYTVDPISFNKGTVASSFIRDAGTIARDFAQVMDDLGIADEATIAKLETLDKAIGTQAWSSVGGFKRRTMDRIGVGGWKGDKPWKTPTENAKDATEVMIKYINQAHNFVEAQKAAHEFREFVNANPEKPNLHQLGQVYLDKSFSGTKNLLKPITDHIFNSVAETFGVAPSHLEKFLYGIKQGTAALTMGFGNATTAAIQIMQGGINVPGEAVRIYAKGKQIPLGAPQALVRGVINTALYLPNKGLKKMGKAGVYLTEEDKIIADYLEKNGITDTYVVDPGLTHSPSLAKEMTEHVMTGSIRTSDQLGRVWFFSSIVGVLRDTGLTLEQAMDKARDLTDITMAPSGTHNQMQGFKKLGPVGEFAGNLKTFAINDLSNWVYDIKAAGKSKADAAALMTKMGVIMGAAGVMGLPGFQDLDKVWKALRDLYGTKFNDPDVLNAPSLTETVLTNLPPSAGFGPLSSSTGVNMSDSAGFPSVAPDGLSGAIWPLGSAAMDKAKGIGQIAKGMATDDKLKTNEGLTRVFPKNIPLVSNALEKNLSTTLPDGRRAQENPNMRYSMRSEVTPEQEQKRMMGFRDLHEAANKKLQYELSEKQKGLAEALKDVEMSIPEELAKQTINGKNDLVGLLDKYVELGGDPKTFFSKATAAGLSRANLDEMTQHLSRSLQSKRSQTKAADALKKYKQFQENYGTK